LAIKLIVGLGNPGSEYAKTRHNAGFWFLDALLERQSARLLTDSKLHSEVGKLDLGAQRIMLAKPKTFMNKSGQACSALLHYFKLAPEEMLVAHDELDLAPGIARLKFDGGHGGQNGLRDISTQLGHGKFHRLRLGIGHPGHKDQVLSWVLGRPSSEHEAAMRGAIDAAIDVVPLLLADEFNQAMKKLHTPAA
jgi:peptidyl-tRNA hydrolase, PTH1 family